MFCRSRNKIDLHETVEILFTLCEDDEDDVEGALKALLEEDINGVASSCTRWAFRLNPRTSANRASYCDTGNITICHLKAKYKNFICCCSSCKYDFKIYSVLVKLTY